MTASPWSPHYIRGASEVCEADTTKMAAQLTQSHVMAFLPTLSSAQS